MALKHSTKFYLTQTKVNKKPTSLRAFVSFNSIKVPFSTNIYIEPRYRNSSAQEARQTTMFDGAEINGKLKSICDFVDAQFESFMSFPDPDGFKSIWEKRLVKIKP